jgi:hypothetical protein
VGESLRAALNELAEVDPDWLLGVVSPDWFDRYRWEKIAGRGSQAALEEHAPQRVRDCPSLGLLQQVWNQHFERVEGRIGFRDGPAVESAERVISLISRPMRVPAARARPNGWAIKCI